MGFSVRPDLLHWLDATAFDLGLSRSGLANKAIEHLARTSQNPFAKALGFAP